MALRSPNTSHGTVRNHPSIAIRRGDIKISDPIPIPREGPDGLGPQSIKRPSISNLRQIRQSQSSAASNSRRQTQAPTMSYHNQQDSISSSISRESNLQRRRGSALKTVMRKIFGKKRGSDTNGFDTHFTELHIERNGSASPDPGPEGVTFATVPESFRAERSASLSNGPSHLPNSTGSGEGTFTDSTSPMDKQPRRRATLPSLILSDEDAREVVSTFTRSDGATPGTEQQSEARRILDDLRRKQNLDEKRRSRSATALRELARAHQMSPIQWRQGNDERKSWRTSLLGADVPHVITSRPQTGASPVVEEREREVAPSEADETEADTEAESAHYNFGNLLGSMPNDDSITLEQRVITLEVKLLDLELAIAKLQGKDDKRRKNSSKPVRKGSCPAGQLSMSYNSGGSDGSDRSSAGGVCDGRPASTNTLRPNMQPRSPMWHAPSTTSLADMNGITVEQYSALITLIRREQTARRTLESQVTQLQDDIRHLQRVAVGSLTSGTAYPIPSPDAQEVLRFRRAMGPSRSASPAGERSPDQYDSDSENSDPYAGSDPHIKSNLDVGQRQPASEVI